MTACLIFFSSVVQVHFKNFILTLLYFRMLAENYGTQLGLVSKESTRMRDILIAMAIMLFPGPPEPPSDCQVLNQTQAELSVECRLGYRHVVAFPNT
jgi:hypothetical protein